MERRAQAEQELPATKSMKSKNYVYLKGGIVRMRISKSIASLCVATDGGGNITAFPTVIFYQPDMLAELKIGDRVTIEAHMQLRPLRNDNGEIIDYEQSCVGDSICKTPRLLAAYMEGEQGDIYDGGVQADENYALVFGKIRHIYSPNPGLVLLSIKVPSKRNNRMDVCEVVCFKKQAEIAQMLSTDDCIMVYGSIRTRNGKKDKTSKESVTVQNIVCKDILKVSGFGDVD